MHIKVDGVPGLVMVGFLDVQVVSEYVLHPRASYRPRLLENVRWLFASSTQTAKLYVPGALAPASS